jgi:FeS assembly SUF system protein
MRWFRRKNDQAPQPAKPDAEAAGPAVAGMPASALAGGDGAEALAAERPAMSAENSAASGVTEPVSAPVDPVALRDSVIEALRTIYDPEIPVNIYDIGLIYQLEVAPTGHVDIRMTLTSPMCPVAESLPPEVENNVAAVPGVTGVKLDLVWDPPWNPTMMSEEARLLLNIG